ncbi:MAG: TetR/AcrR family transcriptional regulator [Lapillicoccus sp.]
MSPARPTLPVTQPPVTQPRITKRRAETRQRLLTAGLEVFARKGYGHVSIEELCTAAGYTRGAFYSQFDSLHDLFLALYDQRAEATTAQLSDDFARSNDVDESLPALVERVLASLTLDRDWLLVSADFRIYAARHPEVAERLASHRAGLVDTLTQGLQPRLERAPISGPLSTADSAARAVVAVYEGVTAELIVDHDVDAARAWLGQLLIAMLSGDAHG